MEQARKGNARRACRDAQGSGAGQGGQLHERARLSMLAAEVKQALQREHDCREAPRALVGKRADKRAELKKSSPSHALPTHVAHSVESVQTESQNTQALHTCVCPRNLRKLPPASALTFCSKQAGQGGAGRGMGRDEAPHTIRTALPSKMSAAFRFAD